MDIDDIENVDDVTKQVQIVMDSIRALVVEILKSVDAYFKEDENVLYRCPNCDYEFIPEEAGIHIKTFSDWYKLQEENNTVVANLDDAINERLFRAVANIIGIIKPKQSPQEAQLGINPEDLKQMESALMTLKPTLSAISNINEIMNIYKKHLSESSDIPNNVEYQILKKIDSELSKAITELNSLGSA